MMRNKRLFIVIFIVLISVAWASQGYSLTKNTHEAINEKVAKSTINGFSLDSYLKNNLGFNAGVNEELDGIDANGINVKKKIFWWLGYGGRYEDIPGSLGDLILNKARANNHYHNPLKPWNGAGLNDKLPVLGWYTGQSEVLWSQNRNQQVGGKWSWPDAREYFYIALTGKNFAGTYVPLLPEETEEEKREKYFAKTFRAVGQLMHLVEDASVPQHARNDIHLLYAYEDAVEKIRKKYPTQWNDWMNNPISFDKAILDIPSDHPNAPVPISRIIDTDKYDRENPDPDITTDKVCSINTSIACNIDSDCPEPQEEKCNVSTIGMSEYSNANFLTEDTMLTDDLDPADRRYFPFPSSRSTIRWTDETNNRKYLRKTSDGETVNHLAIESFLYNSRLRFFPEYDRSLPIGLDDKCYADYASLLIPRAVGYSAGLLDYFFRGEIEISLPDTGVYNLTANPAQGFTGITLLAKNVSPNAEEMTDGSIELVVKHRLALDDPFQSYPVPTTEEFSYIVVPEANNIRSIPGGNTGVELTFDLSWIPIPLYATDVYLQVVYKGKLGQENGAVVVGFKDISEPTPIDLFNDADMICLNGGCYEAGSPEAIAEVDTNQNGIADEWDVYSHDVRDIYVRFSPAENPQYASSTEYDFYVSAIAAGEFSRALFILSDYQFNYSFYESWIGTDLDDHWIHLDTSSLFPGTAIKNQTESTGRVSPTFYPFRGEDMWWGGGLIYLNLPYPTDSQCSDALCYTLPASELDQPAYNQRFIKTQWLQAE